MKVPHKWKSTSPRGDARYLSLAEMAELVALQLALLEPFTAHMPSELIGYLKRELR